MSTTTRVIGVDFETYYDNEVGINQQGSYNYCRHPKFDAYLVTIADTEGNEYAGRPEDFDFSCICQPGDVWVSHNRSFDETVYRALVAKGVLPAHFPEEWHCTADMTAYLGFPRSLKNAAKYLLNAEVSKTTRDQMKGKRWSDMSEEFRKEVLAYAGEDARLCRDLFVEYGYLWPQHERDYSGHTVLMTSRGVPINTEKMDAAIELLKRQIWEAERDIPWPWDPDKTPLSAKSLAKKCREVGIEPPASLALDSPECAEWEDTYGDTYPWVAAMRTWRRCNMLLKKLVAMRAREKYDQPGWMSYSQMYFGSHTGRDSGGSGENRSGGGSVNMQNLPQGEMFGVNVRHMIEAPPGYVFVSADYSQIEARITAWFAGDEALLDLVRSGVDIYESHARATMGYRGEEPLKNADPTMRQLAKARVLSLGFGCGPGKFRAMAKMKYKLEISEAEAKKIVNEYRRETPVPKLWRKIEADFWSTRDRTHQIELPSGRCLTYREVTRSGDEYTKQLTVAVPRGAGFARAKTWGGTLTENLVQATARDLFVLGVLRVEAAGYPVLMRIHDEILVMVPEAGAEESRRHIEELMCVLPDWAEGLPVAAEAKIVTKYTKG
jgi:hypothetical protein